MALKNISITIDDHDSTCTLYYLVEYKLTTDTAYQNFTTSTNPIIIRDLADASMYDVCITRYCCNGGTSTAVCDVIDTTSNSPQMDIPAAFTLTAGGGAGELDAAWTAVTTPANADTYYCEVSTMSTFNVIAHVLITAHPTVTGTITGAETGVLYYGRVKAQKAGYADSDWSNVDTATAP